MKSTQPKVYSIDSLGQDGSLEAVVFQTEFSGILTGNLGKSYIYAKPVTEVMAPRFIKRATNKNIILE